MKKFLATLAALALGTGLAVGTGALAASAHTADITGSAVCQTDGTYTITWTVKTSNVPSNTYGEAKVISPFQQWLFEWPEHAANHGLSPLQPNSTFQFTQTGVPGSNTKADVMVQIDWKDGFSHDPTGKVTLPGDCTTPPPPVDVCPNIDGNQDVVPEGYVLENGQCVLPPPPPPTNQVCEVNSAGPVSTDLNDLWANVDTRSAGHVEYVDGALHVWTDDNSSQAKVSEGISVNFPLSQTGMLDIDASANPGNSYQYGPGLNLFVDFDNNGSVDGTLVYEEVYGQDLWLTNGSAQFVKDGAPVVGGGNGSQWHGTINQWLTVFGSAQVKGVAYSLGSGVHGDWNINSITVNCTVYTFDVVDRPAVPEPKVEVTYSEFGGDDPTCEEPTVEWTRTRTTVTTPYKVVVVEGAYQVVEDTDNITTVTVTDEQTKTVEYEGECETTPPPTTPPTDLPPTNALATTGADPTAPLWAAAILLSAGAALGTAALVRRRIASRK